jgi:hypothetical protein
MMIPQRLGSARKTRAGDFRILFYYMHQIDQNTKCGTNTNPKTVITLARITLTGNTVVNSVHRPASHSGAWPHDHR